MYEGSGDDELEALEEGEVDSELVTLGLSEAELVTLRVILRVILLEPVIDLLGLNEADNERVDVTLFVIDFEGLELGVIVLLTLVEDVYEGVIDTLEEILDVTLEEIVDVILVETLGVIELVGVTELVGLTEGLSDIVAETEGLGAVP